MAAAPAMSNVERLRAEQREAVRLLLRSPLVFVDRPDPAGFGLVLRHADPLADFFRDTFGWTLLVDPRRRFARLAKRTFNRRDATRGIWLRDRAAPFDPFRYALLCLACYELDALTGDQLLFSQIVDLLAAHKDPGLPRFDPVELGHRRALNDVFAWLELSGVVVLRAGNAQRYFDGVDDDDPFYDLDRGVLAALLVTPTSPSLAADAATATAEPYADTERGRLDRVRHSVYRQIVDDPAVLDADLGADERAYLAGQLGVRIREEVTRWTGMSIERRAEGLAAIDEDGDLHDGYRLPAEGVLAHATLLLGEWFADRVRAQAGPDQAVAADATIATHVRRLIAAHRRHWGKTYREMAPDSDRGTVLAERATAFLEGLRLVRRVDGGWIGLPPVARFRAKPVDDEPETALQTRLMIDTDDEGVPT